MGLVIAAAAIVAMSLVFARSLSATTPPLATITLLPEAEVVGTAITLGEIAEIDYHMTREDQTTSPELNEIYVGRAPLPGNSRQIAVGHVEVRLRQAGIHPSTVVLIPPPGGVVRVSCATQEVTKTMVCAVVLEHLTEQAGADFHIGVEAGDALPLVVPLGELELRFEAPPLGPGSYRVSVGVYVDGQRYRTIQVRIQLQPKKPIVIAVCDIQAGSTIQPEAVQKAILDTSPPKDAFLEPAAVVGLETQRTIMQGEPIRADDVAAPVTIRIGDQVVIEAVSGTIAIKTLGIALQSGALGDLIRVENAESHKEIQARIKGKGVVQLELHTGK